MIKINCYLKQKKKKDHKLFTYPIMNPIERIICKNTSSHLVTHINWRLQLESDISSHAKKCRNILSPSVVKLITFVLVQCRISIYLQVYTPHRVPKVKNLDSDASPRNYIDRIISRELRERECSFARARAHTRSLSFFSSFRWHVCQAYKRRCRGGPSITPTWQLQLSPKHETTSRG